MNREESLLADQDLTEVMGVFGYSMTSFEAKMWATIIDAVPLSSFQAFLRQHVLTSKFAPKPSDAAGAFGLAGADADTAYAELTKAVRECGPYQQPVGLGDVLVSTVNSMGGWAAVNEQMPDVSNTYAVKAFRDRFDTSFKLAVNEVVIQGNRPPALVPIGGESALRIAAPQQPMHRIQGPRA